MLNIKLKIFLKKIITKFYKENINDKKQIYINQSEFLVFSSDTFFFKSLIAAFKDLFS